MTNMTSVLPTTNVSIPPSSVDIGIFPVFFMTIINATFFPVDNILQISFDTRNYSYTLYHVEFLISTHELDGCEDEVDEDALWNQNIPAQYPTTEVNISWKFPNGDYCIRVTPVRKKDGGSCKSGCRTENKRITLNNSHNEYGQSCKNWNASVGLDPIPYGKNLSLKVSIHINEEFVHCFKFLRIDLWFGAKDVCNTSTGHAILRVIGDYSPGEIAMYIFKDLVPGNYCVRIYGRYSASDDWSVPLYTAVRPIYGSFVESPNLVPSLKHENLAWLYVLILPLVLVMAGLFFLRKRIHLLCFPKTDFPILNPDPPVTMNQLVTMAETCAKELEVVLLYSRDFPQHEEVVSAFREFLLEVWGLGAVRFTLAEEADICVDVNNWVEGNITNKINRRFVIVESEGGVIQEEQRKTLKILQPKDEDYLDAIFPYAIQLLKVDSMALCGYQVVYVVRFDYTPSNLRLKSIVPHRRYQLPKKHLFELYWDLLQMQDSTFFFQIKGELEKRWAPQLQRLLIPRIDSAREILQHKPTIIRDTFQERDLFETDV